MWAGHAYKFTLYSGVLSNRLLPTYDQGGDVAWVLFLSSTIYGLSWLFALLALLEGFLLVPRLSYLLQSLFKIPVTHQVTASAIIPANTVVASSLTNVFFFIYYSFPGRFLIPYTLSMYIEIFKT